MASLKFSMKVPTWFVVIEMQPAVSFQIYKLSTWCPVIAPQPKEALLIASLSVYTQGQRIFVVEKVRNVFAVGEAFSI